MLLVYMDTVKHLFFDNYMLYYYTWMAVNGANTKMLRKLSY